MTTVVVQVAMDEEAQPFLDAASEVSEPVRIARAEHRGVVVDGRTFVLVRSGIGMVNAADAAVGALHRYGDDVLLVSAGSAGGLAADVEVGDVFVGMDYVNVEADARAFGYEAGQVPGMPASYAPDPLAVAALTASAPDGVRVRGGGIGSGEKFVTVEIAHRLREVFPGIHVVDMETAAIAQTAFNHGVRFVSVRAISDLCAPDGTEFLTHVDDAAERSAKAVLAALPQLVG
ncbi:MULTISPECIES: 5'-methylthioadenosine/S-adenosylhomocysteine nucleosidase [Microbacterium]|uniref:adenosylhomocysteine nucleosidase n=1 Tax=Microbacterium barkeri TaxID=33917 RepID=A0A9W6H277_9MICO|nr:5'-methylthioadenosine/S-adenosylhomocysteine nucleosidase [Microbacterium barkeri]MDI6942650.1 5'-methylthioadenosine/S-adenosylhomocysteine nucleosidase [Microbacterium barkeri]MDR6875190.1 adenosylhomocysteine nucleosidase [Microbacterium barkeri]GLJ60649.1 5'-methylthioadenosine/S-adenosylhomocysteine nucleosidase [Microbacterium barkeri]